MEYQASPVHYPFIIDATGDDVKGYISTKYPLELMHETNRKSIYHDGIENVTDGKLVYTDELLEKVRKRFGVELPKEVPIDQAESVAQILINDIILPSQK